MSEGIQEASMDATGRQPGSEHEAKAAHLAKMRKVAGCIVDSVPSWLPEALSDWSFNVKSQDSIDRIWPTRKELWNSLAHGASSAIELQTVLTDIGLTEFLITNSDLESDEFLHGLASQLSKFTAYAAKACRSPLLVGKDGKLLPGASKPLLPGVMPARYVCAAIIAETISFLADRGKPVPSKRKAHNAAEEFWKAWPSKAKGERTVLHKNRRKRL